MRWQRRALRLTLTELGHQTGFSIGFLSMVESGKRVPSPAAEATIRYALGMAEPLPYDRRSAPRPAPVDLVARLGACLVVVPQVELVMLGRAVGATVGDVRHGLLELAELLGAAGMTVLDDGAQARLAPARHMLQMVGAVAAPRRGPRLTMARMEVLAVLIAHGAATLRQVEDVRGVDCRDLLAGLVTDGFVWVNADESAPGHPNVYRPTVKVLEALGGSTIEELRAQLGTPPEIAGAAEPVSEGAP